MNYIYFVILSFILLILPFCLLTYLYYRRKRESFVELSDVEIEKLREDRGLEKCKSLLVNKEHISDENFLMMTHYIDGLRIRKWKPNKDEKINIDPSKEYCYMYNDPLNKTQDYLLENNPDNTFNSCSSDNPIFKSDLVTNVFESEHTDKSHNVPIKKCIFEMDKEKLNDSRALSQFWSNFGKHDCFMLGQNIRDDLREKETAYNGLILNKDKKYGEMIAKSNEVVVKQNELSNCNSEVESIKREYNDFDGKLEICNAKNTPLEKRIEQLKKDISKLKREISELENEKQNFIDLYHESLRNFNKCHKTDHPECERLSSLLKNQIEYYNNEIEKVEERIKNLRELIAGKEKEFREKTEEYTGCTTKLNNLEELLGTKRREYNIVVDSNIECASNLNYYIDGYNTYKNNYNESSNVFFECENEKGILDNRLESCRDTVGSCINYISYLSEKNWDEEIDDENVDNYVSDINFSDLSTHFKGIETKVDTLKEKTIEYKNKFNTCTKENAKLISDIETLNERKNTLRANIQDIETRQKDTSSQSLKSIVSNAKEMNDKIIPEYLSLFKDQTDENLKNKCSLNNPELELEYNAAVQETKMLENELAALTSSDQTCNTDCDITLPQCLIHKNHEQICGAIAIQKDNGDGVDPKAVSATVDFYDQTNDKVQTLEIKEANQEYRVTISGSTELKYFVFNNNNPASETTYSYKATTGRLGDENSLCDESSWSARPYAIGNIEPSTTYLKVILYRGITCVKIASNKLRISNKPSPSKPQPRPSPSPSPSKEIVEKVENNKYVYDCTKNETRRRGRGNMTWCGEYRNRLTGRTMVYQEFGKKFNIPLNNLDRNFPAKR